MSRSIKKGPFVQEVLFKRVEEMNKAGEKKVLKTWSRSSTIFPEFVGHTPSQVISGFILGVVVSCIVYFNF